MKIKEEEMASRCANLLITEADKALFHTLYECAVMFKATNERTKARHAHLYIALVLWDNVTLNMNEETAHGITDACHVYSWKDAYCDAFRNLFLNVHKRLGGQYA